MEKYNESPQNFITQVNDSDFGGDKDENTRKVKCYCDKVLNNSGLLFYMDKSYDRQTIFDFLREIAKNFSLDLKEITRCYGDYALEIHKKNVQKVGDYIDGIFKKSDDTK